MPKIDFPVNPIREKVYSRDELFSTFNINDVDSYITTLDFKAYSDFKVSGGSFPSSYYVGMMRSLHDFSIWNDIQEIMQREKIIGIMGGHEMERTQYGIYAKIAKLAYQLTNKGFLITSGGGSGAMEATHLGAYFSRYSEDVLDEALKYMSARPKLPENYSKIIDDNGVLDKNIADKLHDWIKPAFELLQKYPIGGESLAVPTWLYGHEPPCPFASHIAKYYQNSIREDGLLAIAKYGVIYCEGKAGTIQEIFQDANQNYYKTVDWFSPMVFLDKDYWTKKFPVKNILDKLIAKDDNSKYIKYTDDINEVVDFICKFKPVYKK